MPDYLNTREEIIANYLLGYNTFNIDQMVRDLDECIIFENIQNGEVTFALTGLAAFKQQAEQAKAYFTQRTQSIRAIHHSGNQTTIEINYHAIMAIDLPNGLKKGQELQLASKSIFELEENRIVKLTDIS